MKLIARFPDHEYPLATINHTRRIVRGIVYNDTFDIVLIHVLGDDMFGHRDALETPGGGIEEGEDNITALKREIMEELGYEIDNIKEIGMIEDYYNLINRRNENNYYLCHISGKIETHQTEFESRFFKEIVVTDIDTAIRMIENQKAYPWTNLVRQRELPILYIAKEMLSRLK